MTAVVTDNVSALPQRTPIKPVAVSSSNHKGWKASLDLSFEAGPQQPVVRRRHSGPLTIQRPFYPENSVAHVYLLHPPGGVVGGDALSINTSTESGAAGLVTTPGATKFYRSSGRVSQVSQKLDVHGGSLEWFPQENIYFNDCLANIETTVDIKHQSSLALWDIHCFGRPAGQAFFERGSVCNQLKVIVDGASVFRDRLIVDETNNLSQYTGLRHCCVTGTLILNKMTKDACDMARQKLQYLPEFFVTLVDSLLLVRYIGNNAQKAKEGFASVWSQLRYQLNQQTPCVPRIWST